MKNLWCAKNEDDFVLHNNEILIFSWHVIIFLLLRDDENISPWHNIENISQNKNLVLAKIQVCAEKKRKKKKKKKLILHKM